MANLNMKGMLDSKDKIPEVQSQEDQTIEERREDSLSLGDYNEKED